MSELPILPVSYGEAFDKLSILEIKLKFINDDVKRKDVQIEYNMLYSQLNTNLSKIKYHYDILITINTEIWHSMDKIRLINEKDNQVEWVYECKKTITDNDRRFRVKHKINHLLSSHLKEQKSYKHQRAFIQIHLGHVDMLAMNGIIRYYSTFFDEVIISCKQSDISSIALIFADDPTIRLVSIDSYKTMISESDVIIDENDCLKLDKSIIDKYSYNALYPV